MSVFIRPLTLVLRLCANMLAGHVIITVFSGLFLYVFFSSVFSSFLLFFFCLVFFLFEVGVCVVQSVVFVLLLHRYFVEALC
ncbi:MAG: ATP synthase subunit a [Ignavibacteria bacterium]|nr:MAG: ATP synthase subunit a [Ignavibacteria bacterium]